MVAAPVPLSPLVTVFFFCEVEGEPSLELLETVSAEELVSIEGDASLALEGAIAMALDSDGATDSPADALPSSELIRPVKAEGGSDAWMTKMSAIQPSTRVSAESISCLLSLCIASEIRRSLKMLCSGKGNGYKRASF